MIDLLALVMLLAGCFFVFAGTVGMLRLPDVYCRLHALTKADNLGLLLICLSLALLAGRLRITLLLLLIWLLALLASTVSAHLIARHSRARRPPTGEPQ
ncbi:MAG: monovalent cation/H(+) antiporter subunit G [Wenzhouxiangellaceae bacterium]|nr:monovalent cation/H(+) antiporter subunit G [Wenzhouxiangellaceae bacterium]MBS3747556.1 monovalent cation/H(+) antiporter subunit G [Wenzhouxiangellaceae bacterium]